MWTSFVFFMIFLFLDLVMFLLNEACYKVSHGHAATAEKLFVVGKLVGDAVMNAIDPKRSRWIL